MRRNDRTGRFAPYQWTLRRQTRPGAGFGYHRAGHVPISEVGSTCFQETNLKAIFEDICVFNEYVSDPRQLPRLVQLAAQTALTQGGVAHLSVPSDVINLEVPRSAARVSPIPQSVTLPCPDELAKAVAILSRGGKIAILAGDGCRGTRKELLDLAQKLNAPIVRTLRATDIVEYEDI